MSVEYCHECGKNIDTDFEDHECFWKKEEWNLSDKMYGNQLDYYDVRKFIRKVLDIVGKLPESADTVRAFHTIKELAGEKLIVPQDFDVSLDKTLPNTAGSEGDDVCEHCHKDAPEGSKCEDCIKPKADDVIKFRMMPWDKHGNKPKAEDGAEIMIPDIESYKCMKDMGLLEEKS